VLIRDAAALETLAEVEVIAFDKTGTLTEGRTVKPEAREAVGVLQRMGRRVVMLTGDREAVAHDVANQLGISEFHANLHIRDKADFILKWQQEGRKVAMVGDGINDAPALARADVGIAMSTGTDVAMESAGMTLLHGDLRGLVRAMELSRATRRNIRQNLFFAFGYNALAIPLAAAAFLTPILAGAAMSLSSISVILNALRLKR